MKKQIKKCDCEESPCQHISVRKLLKEYRANQEKALQKLLLQAYREGQKDGREAVEMAYKLTLLQRK